MDNFQVINRKGKDQVAATLVSTSIIVNIGNTRELNMLDPMRSSCIYHRGFSTYSIYSVVNKMIVADCYNIRLIGYRLITNIWIRISDDSCTVRCGDLETSVSP